MIGRHHVPNIGRSTAVAPAAVAVAVLVTTIDITLRMHGVMIYAPICIAAAVAVTAFCAHRRNRQYRLRTMRVQRNPYATDRVEYVRYYAVQMRISEQMAPASGRQWYWLSEDGFSPSGQPYWCVSRAEAMHRATCALEAWK